MRLLKQNELGTLCICAIRYCHGRMSYMPSLVMEIVGKHLEDISDKDLKIMVEDCDFQEKMNLYGDPVIDKPDWLRWKETLEKEKKRRRL